MTAEAITASEFVAMQVQAVFIDHLIQESADYELAFQMQLDEALRVSGVSGVGSSSSTTLQVGDAGDGDVMDSEPADHTLYTVEEPLASITEQNIMEDLRASMTEQKEEVQKLHQEMDDAVVALKEQERFRQLEAVTQHDAHFARFLSTIGPDEWSEGGDTLSDPFTIPSAAEVPISKEGQGQNHASRAPKSGLDLGGASTSVSCRGDVWEPALAAAYFLEPGSKRYMSTVSFKGGPAEEHDLGTLLRQNFRDLEGNCPSLCTICMDTVMSPKNSTVVSDKCKHDFCKDCLRKHAETAVKSGKSYITCPALGCQVLWSAKLSSEMLSSGSQLLLEQRQIEEAVPSAERVYCPYRDCSTLQLKPDAQTPASSSNHPHATAIGGVECFFCNRFFCLECQVPWHSEMSCEEFQRLPVDEKTAEDRSFKNLASSKKWQRCTRCGFMVELKSGCYHISCRCGHDFCYTCGGAWASGHICKT